MDNLYQNFLEAFKSSVSYGLLTDEQKSNIESKYANVTEEVLMAAIELLNQNNSQQSIVQETLVQNEKLLQSLSDGLHKQLIVSAKNILKEEEIEEQLEEAKVLEKIEGEMDVK